MLTKQHNKITQRGLPSTDSCTLNFFLMPGEIKSLNPPYVKNTVLKKREKNNHNMCSWRLNYLSQKVDFFCFVLFLVRKKKRGCNPGKIRVN